MILNRRWRAMDEKIKQCAIAYIMVARGVIREVATSIYEELEETPDKYRRRVWRGLNDRIVAVLEAAEQYDDSQNHNI